MSRSNFTFSQSALQSQDLSYEEEDDDTDYDALNNETFGEDVPSTDWEEEHEQLSSQMERGYKKQGGFEKFDDENNELSERVASFILDDEDVVPDHLVNTKPAKKTPFTKSRPSQEADTHLWFPENNQRAVDQSNNSNTLPKHEWWQGNQPKDTSSASNGAPGQMPRIMTVEELENRMRSEASRNAGYPPSTSMDRTVPPNMVQNQSMNGQYNRNRHPLPPLHIRGRFPQQDRVPEQYQTIHPRNQPFPDMMPQQRTGLPHNMRPGPGPNPRFRAPPQLPHRHQGHVFYPRTFPEHQYRRQSHPGLHPGPQPGPSHLHPPQAVYQQMQQCASGGFAQAGPVHMLHGNEDEHAGLMSNQEKDFLRSIQMLQLNSAQPFQDDYYYVMYQYRHQGNPGRKQGNQGPKNNRDGAGSRPTPSYTPQQFENSLGKLQVGSVMAPRIIIDREIVEQLESNNRHTEKKSKQILLEIEEMYKILIQLEDMFNPLQTSTPKKTPTDLQTPLLDKLINHLLTKDKLVPVMSIRKGKTLVLRLLCFVAGLRITSNGLSLLVYKLLIDLTSITRKDPEQMLLSFLPAIRSYISTANLKTLVEIVNSHEKSPPIYNKFTLSVLANMVERAAQVFDECEDKKVQDEWVEVLGHMALAAKQWAEADRPVVAVDRGLLTKHLAKLEDSVDPQLSHLLIRTLSSNLQTN